MIKHKNPALFNISMTAVLFSLFLFISNDFHQGFFSLKQWSTPSIATSDSSAIFSRLLKGGHREGSADAPVQIVEFLDFQCPYCKQMVSILDAMRFKYPEQIAITYYNFPLKRHPQSVPAAVAAECAANQGRYVPFHNLLFANQDKFSVKPWDSLAVKAGVPDLDAFKGCVNRQETKSLVEKEVHLGDSLKVEYTPTFFINGVKYVGTLSEEKMDKIIRKNLVKSDR